MGGLYWKHVGSLFYCEQELEPYKVEIVKLWVLKQAWKLALSFWDPNIMTSTSGHLAWAPFHKVMTLAGQLSTIKEEWNDTLSEVSWIDPIHWRYEDKRSIFLPQVDPNQILVFTKSFLVSLDNKDANW